MTLERLLEDSNKITALLGRTISIKEHAVKAFRKRIGEYADSHNKKDEVQAWPLVKVCKLRHNWQVRHRLWPATSRVSTGPLASSLDSKAYYQQVCNHNLMILIAMLQQLMGKLAVSLQPCCVFQDYRNFIMFNVALAGADVASPK